MPAAQQGGVDGGWIGDGELVDFASARAGSIDGGHSRAVAVDDSRHVVASMTRMIAGIDSRDVCAAASESGVWLSGAPLLGPRVRGAPTCPTLSRGAAFDGWDHLGWASVTLFVLGLLLS
jgi:hypothetical protein